MAKKNENASGSQASEGAKIAQGNQATGAQEPDSPDASKKNDDDKRIMVSLRHKTTYPRYYRAGLALANKFQDFPVTKEQLAILEKDPWVEVKKS